VLEQPKGTKEVMAKKKPRRAAGGRKQGRVRSKKSPMRKAKRAGAARSTAPKRKAAKKKASASRRAAKARPRKATAAAPTRKAAAAKTRRPAGKAKARSKAATAAASPRAVRTASRRPANLDRERRTVTDAVVPTPPSSLSLDRSASAARSGRAEMNHRFREHTSTGPAMTAGDVDADWESAESVGDEAPGGDNPTPDQDVVDEIGKALGVEYDDDEELQGGEEITERDRNRWELDPASRDDFDDRED
jgi:Family of unknown function (DUF6335)